MNPEDVVEDGVVRLPDGVHVLGQQQPVAAQVVRDVHVAGAVGVQPQRIEIVRLPREMTFDEFVAAYPSDADRDTLLLVNGVRNAAAAIPAGTPMKRLVGGVASGR